jgi:glycosyltransferase involved in cell wall biosynthesis
MTRIKITIGICTKNSEKTIGEAIRSALCQDFFNDNVHGHSFENIEIIVVDACSKDKTINIIQNILSETRVKYILLFDKGEGLSAARQMVLENASGDYILWLDSDVVLSNSFLKSQLDFMEKNPEVGIVKGKAEYCERTSNLIGNVHGLLLSTLETNIATICRTKALKEANGFDKRIRGACEDVDIETRMLLKGWRSVMNSTAKFYHVAKDTLKSIYAQNVWYGEGEHFLHHKYEGFVDILRKLPPIPFLFGLTIARKAYWKYRKKKAFLIPFLCVFISICWLLGFIKGHLEGYGHSITEPEIRRETLLLLGSRGIR